MKDKKNRKFIILLTIIASAVTLISIVINIVLPLYLSHQLALDGSKSSSVGIIGGADGPTTIFLASSSTHQLFPYQNTILFGMVAIAGIIYLVRTKKIDN